MAPRPRFLIDIMKESEFFGMQTFDQSMLRLVVDGSSSSRQPFPTPATSTSFGPRRWQPGSRCNEWWV